MTREKTPRCVPRLGRQDAPDPHLSLLFGSAQNAVCTTCARSGVNYFALVDILAQATLMSSVGKRATAEKMLHVEAFSSAKNGKVEQARA